MIASRALTNSATTPDGQPLTSGKPLASGKLPGTELTSPATVRGFFLLRGCP